MCVRRMLPSCLPLIAAVLLSPPLSAQVPDSAQASEQAERDGWRTQVDLGLNSSSGNSSLTTILTGISLKRLETDRIEFEISANYRYGRSEGRTITDLFQTGLKLDINPKAKWSPFLFTSTTRNPVRRLDLRANVGAGWKYTNWRTARGKNSVSLASIFNYEDFDGSGATVVETEKTARWSGRVKFNLYFGKGAEYEFITFYQPVWDELDDYYLNVDNSLRIPVVAGLSLVVRYEFRHDETPAPGVKENDNFVTMSFRYVF